MSTSPSLQHYWIDTYHIRSYWVDANRRAKVTAILNFFQESAWHHAEHLGVGFEAFLTRQLIWVLARLQVRFYRMPWWKDEVRLRTWPSGRDRLFCYRDFQVLSTGEEILCEGTSTWFAVDIANRRPQPTERYFNLPLPEKMTPVWERWAPKVQPAPHITVKHHHRVSWYDLDVNQHTNNVRYVEWMLADLPEDFLEHHRLTELQVNFVAESNRGEEIAVSLMETSPTEIYFELRREDNRQVICRARTIWNNRSH